MQMSESVPWFPEPKAQELWQNGKFYERSRVLRNRLVVVSSRVCRAAIEQINRFAPARGRPLFVSSTKLESPE